ncbi:hypothetical protein AB0E11_24330 [Streptomyces fradiae]|uniref:Secreted protein n=1 Tax=Streptomyces rubrolavendulae TaxID=285473 RepID=A0A1D8G2L1_9ACTN|nr:hypothetical protein [Streptomyces rubrolavendulae]AOT59680.1 hypothetical protein A4G23_02523 [Streptomyces rubrolavendulae]
MKSLLTRVVLPSFLVVGAIGGSAAHIAVTVSGADRTVPTTVWADAPSEPADDPAAEAWRGRASTPLGEKLLPVPDGFQLGPDLGEHGNDAELGPRAAAAVLRETGDHLSGPQRAAFDKMVDGLGVQAVAMRSYATEYAPRGGVYEEDTVVAIRITRLQDGAKASRLHTYQVTGLGWQGYEEGPDVKGHKDASCHMAPEDEDDRHMDQGLTEMVCLGRKGDLLVTVNAQGAGPFGWLAADMVREQFDRIDSPGKKI